jgi:hypothetical protein
MNRQSLAAKTMFYDELLTMSASMSAANAGRERCREAGMDEYVAKPIEGRAIESLAGEIPR